MSSDDDKPLKRLKRYMHDVHDELDPNMVEQKMVRFMGTPSDVELRILLDVLQQVKSTVQVFVVNEEETFGIALNGTPTELRTVLMECITKIGKIVAKGAASERSA